MSVWNLAEDRKGVAAIVQFVITSDYHDSRLDKFIRKTFRDVTLTNIYRFIRKGRIRVNGRKRKPGYRLQEHDIVHVHALITPTCPRDAISLTPRQKQQALDWIVFENDDLVVCNKPPGLAMHRGSGHEYGLLEMVQAALHNPELTFVHRIDRATSGLVAGAKNRRSARELSAMFRRHDIAKYYMVMVGGVVNEEQFTITSFLKKEESRVVEQETDSHGVKKAVSQFSVVHRYKTCTLLNARLLTGRTHQLRVQLAGYGHPIVGDVKYGGQRAEYMLLFSHRLVIDAWGLDVQAPLPLFFKRKT